MGTAITIDNLVKVFGSGQQAARAVDGISLDIEPGELFFLLGPSGCGKTTLLRMIAGFIEPTSGTIRFTGKAGKHIDVTRLPPNKRNTGMVFQSYALWPHMTVETNVAFGLGVRKVPADEKAKRVAEALRDVQMEVYAKRKPTQLSGGQQQRVALARALVIRPDVLLLDEPLSNLDAKLRNDLRLEIRRICKDAGLTTIYVTHDQKEALSMADRVAVLRAGKLEQLGTPRELYRAPASRFVAEFLGETNLVAGTISAGANGQADGHAAFAHPGGSWNVATNGHTPVAGQAQVSVRPEALRLVRPDTPGAIVGTVTQTVYLGEVAQHEVDIGAGTPLKIAELNPFGVHEAGVITMPAPGDKVGVLADAHDVVLLPAE